jgi:antitoxin component HigA of HigAB toxin-antitoxin module
MGEIDCFIVECEYTINGIVSKEIATEENWFLLSQSGHLYTHSPANQVPEDAVGYDSLTVRFKIGDKYLSIKEIKKELDLLETFRSPIAVLNNRMMEMGLTQKEIANAIGCSQANVSMMLGGTRMPSDKWIAKITNLLQRWKK